MMLMHQKNGENNIINKEMQQLLNKTKKQKTMMVNLDKPRKIATGLEDVKMIVLGINSC